MLKNAGVDINYKVIRYTPDTEKKIIEVEIASGNNVNGVFVSDERGLIKHYIKNIPERAIQQIDTLIIDAAGQVTLSCMPLNNNQIEIDGVTQDHVAGPVVTCTGYSENDSVTVKYYYNEPGRNWFNEAAAFRQVDHPECIGMDDYEYNSHRIWSILVAMGLMSGEVV